MRGDKSSRRRTGRLAKRRRGIEEQYRAWSDSASHFRQIEFAKKSVRVTR
jgi:hypothetical protein